MADQTLSFEQIGSNISSLELLVHNNGFGDITLNNIKLEPEIENISISGAIGKTLLPGDQSPLAFSYDATQETQSNDTFRVTIGEAARPQYNFSFLATPPCGSANAPTISSITKVCLSDDPHYIYYDVAFTDDIGVILDGSYGGAPNYENLYSYPVKLWFKIRRPDAERAIAANAYNASLLSGENTNGQIRIKLTLASNVSCKETDFYDTEISWHDTWQVSLINSCGLSSDSERFPVTYWSHNYGN